MLLSRRTLALWVLITNLAGDCLAKPSFETSSSQPYAPQHVVCPTDALVRPATRISTEELSYTTRRKAFADRALTTWLSKVWDLEVPTRPHRSARLPTLALAMSGGGPKAALLAAGVLQALDARDSNYSVSGLLQSMSYLSALSGGSIALGGVIGNDFTKISTLRNELWNVSFQALGKLPLEYDAAIRSDLAAKTAAGYATTLLDVYGRLMGYDFIGGPGGANNVTWSKITNMPAFTDYSMPFPIITLTNANVAEQQCLPNTTGAIWEVSPYEFGSWNASIQAFLSTKYLGTSLRNGIPTDKASCTIGFDNLSLMMAMSADILVDSSSVCSTSGNITSGLNTIAEALSFLATPSLAQVGHGYIPNPFLDYPLSSAVNEQTALYMVDGGYSGQGIPIFPFLQPDRNIDVIFVADDESLNAANITDGSALYQTYITAKREGLRRMPRVPNNRTFTAENGALHAAFFGCHNPRVATIIYMPDSNATLTSSDTFSFDVADIDSVINAGIEVATRPTEKHWSYCVACAIMHKEPLRLPEACTACLAQYCWDAWTA